MRCEKTSAKTGYMPEISSQRVDKLAAAVAALSALIDELKGEMAEPPQEIRDRVQAYVAAGICLRCCQKKDGRYTRGMDANCYNQTIKDINRGDVTESELVMLGRITERPLPGGRRATRPPIAALGELPALRPTPNTKEQAGADAAIVAAEQKHARDKRRDRVPRKR